MFNGGWKEVSFRGWTTSELPTLDRDSFIFLWNICFWEMLLSLAPFYVEGIWELAQKLLEPLDPAVGFPQFSAGHTNLNQGWI